MGEWEYALRTGSFAWPRSRAYRDVTPFSCLTWDSGGRSSPWSDGNTIYENVIRVRDSVVFKFAIGYAFEEELEERKRVALRRMNESAQLRIRYEGHIYARLAQALSHRPNIHILQPHLCVSEGVFLPLMWCSMQDRLDTQRSFPLAFSRLARYKGVSIPLHLKLRWTKQLATAIAWMEQVGLVHGDLRPANIFLDRLENVVLADFGSTAEVGNPLVTSSRVYCPDEFGIGDKRSEQYAFAWCLYAIFHGHVPDDFDIADPEKVVFPQTRDLPCSKLIQDCWHGGYASLEDLCRATEREYFNQQVWYHRWLDRGCEILARVTLYLRKDWLLLEMRRAYEDLRDAEEKLRVRLVETSV